MTTFDPEELMRSQEWAKWSDCRDMVQEAHDIGYAAALEAQAARIAELEADAARYRWLRNKGATAEGLLMTGSGSMPVSRGPYVVFDPPALNHFSRMVLSSDALDAAIDTASAALAKQA